MPPEMISHVLGQIATAIESLEHVTDDDRAYAAALRDAEPSAELLNAARSYLRAARGR